MDPVLSRTSLRASLTIDRQIIIADFLFHLIELLDDYCIRTSLPPRRDAFSTRHDEFRHLGNDLEKLRSEKVHREDEQSCKSVPTGTLPTISF